MDINTDKGFQHSKRACETPLERNTTYACACAKANLAVDAWLPVLFLHSDNWYTPACTFITTCIVEFYRFERGHCYPKKLVARNHTLETVLLQGTILEMDPVSSTVQL